MDSKDLYLNGPQARAEIMFCHTELHELSRGVGKTEGVIAPRSERLIHAMPKSTGVFVTKTFRSALTNTIPPVIRGWKNRGYIQGVHFVIGKKPPKWFDEPHTKPLDYKYTISWYNGTVIHFLSQERDGSANGLSIDWIIVDEAKFINREKFDTEIVPANRGNRHLYGDLACHHSIMYCTDRWYGSEASWIDDLKEQVTTDLNKVIEVLSLELFSLTYKLSSEDYSKSYREKILKEVAARENRLNELRKEAVYVNQASAIENISVLGTKFIKEQRKALPLSIFLVTVLNEKRNLSKSPFYPHLDRRYHCYDANNIDVLGGLSKAHRSLSGYHLDTDVIPNQPLYIAIDPGGVINTMVVSQFDEAERPRIINSFFVKKPDKTRHLVQKFCDYYADHPCKEVIYYYDQTHIATHGASEFSYEGITLKTLDDNKWSYAKVYYPVVPEPKDRYQISADLLEKKSSVPGITFNEANCDYLLISLESADTEEHKGIFRKDKSSEKANSGVVQEKATHFSDAFDMLVWGMHNKPYPPINNKRFDLFNA